MRYLFYGMVDIPLYYIAIIACLLVSLLNTYIIREFPYLRFFPYFFLITSIIETIGIYQWDLNFPNTEVYNLFTAFEFVFYFNVLYQIIRNRNVRKMIFWSIIVYPLIALVNIVFIQKIDRFHSITYSLGCLLIVTFCIYYFYEILKYPKAINLTREPAFWICSGILFFYCCTFPIFGGANFYDKYPDLIIKNFTAIVSILNLFLYTLFFIAFICRIQIRKFIL